MFAFKHKVTKNIYSISHSSICINNLWQNISLRNANFQPLLDCRLRCCYATRARNEPVSMFFSSFQSSKEVSKHPPIVIMHGLLGSKNNWKSIGKALNQKTGRTVFTVDARNHGESPHTNDFNYYALANDIHKFLEDQKITQACLIGHSMGGRAMMATALLNPQVVEKLFVLDISPFGVSDGVSIVPRFIDLMLRVEIPSNLELPQARKFIDEKLQEISQDSGLRLFLLSNLEKKMGAFSWRVNLEAVSKNFNPNITTFPLITGGKKFKGLSYFIGGELSDYIRNEDHNHIRTIFPKANFYYLEGAGHWLHADKPQEFIKLIVPLINY